MRVIPSTCVLLCGLVLGVLSAQQSRQVNSRIVGGRNTTIVQHPYQLSLEYHNSHLCGAVLIRRNVALTGALCFTPHDADDFKNVYRMRVGTSFRHEGGNLAAIQDVRKHPQFNEETLNNDIAVVKLCDCFDYSPSFYRIDMVNAGVTIAEGSMTTLTGFGRLAENGEYAPILQVVNMPVVNRERCVQAYTGINVVTDTMLCAGSFEGEFDACGGDAGSPLTHNGQLIGLVSWSQGCAEYGYPGVYTSISAHRPWIDAQLV